MALNGAAFLALWNDVDPARDAEYNCWHTCEHVPERVGIRGVMAGRRYVARERGDDRYFTLYELQRLAALAGAEYVDVVEHPTDWSLSMRPSLRNFQRHPCTTLVSLGSGVAGAIATFRLTQDARSDDALADAAKSLFDEFGETEGITSIHLGVVDADAAFPLKNASATAAGAWNLTHVLLVEGVARAELDAALPRIAAAFAPQHAAIQGTAWQSFDLAFAIERGGLRHAGAHRQHARPDLRARWQ